MIKKASVIIKSVSEYISEHKIEVKLKKTNNKVKKITKIIKTVKTNFRRI